MGYVKTSQLIYPNVVFAGSLKMNDEGQSATKEHICGKLLYVFWTLAWQQGQL